MLKHYTNAQIDSFEAADISFDLTESKKDEFGI